MPTTPITGRGRAALYAAALLLAFVPAWLALRALSPGAPEAVTPEEGPLAPARGRVLVILLDSLQLRDMFGPDMPFLAASRARGAWGVSRVATVPLSIAGTHAVFSGHAAGPLSIFDDFNPGRSEHDNLFRRVAARGGRGAVFGRLLDALYAGDTGRSVYRPGGLLFSQYRQEADEVFGQAQAWLAAEKWDLAAVSVYALDHAGHLETPRSRSYRELLGKVDGQVARLAALAGPWDTVLITSEHGIDDNGFHVSLTPETVDTGFVIWGPGIKKGGPLKVLQPDWAPTLSVLAGVSPYYNSFGLPALDLLDLPYPAWAALSRAFSARYSPGIGTATLELLRELQAGRLGRRPGAFYGAALALLLFGSAWLLIAAGLPAGTARPALVAAAVAAAILLPAGALAASSLAGFIAARAPFSANFIIARPAGALAFLALAAGLPVLLRRLLPGAGARAGLAAAAGIAALGAAIFASEEPYHALCWLAAAVPLAAWGATGRRQWLAVAGAFAAGLLLRRLTFYDALSPLNLPERWVISACAAALVFLWVKYQNPGLRPRALLAAGLCFLPALAVTALPMQVELRALLLGLCLLPALLAARLAREGTEAWLSLWTLMFLLGTSSRLNFLAHAAAVPLFLGLWSACRDLPAVPRGLAACFGIWALYLLPGNDFGLDLYALHDRFILGSAAGGTIRQTAAVIAARFILPAAVLLWGLLRDLPGPERWRLPAPLLLPAACGAGLIVPGLMFGPAETLPWRATGSLVVLSCFLAVSAAAFPIALAIRRFLR